MYSRQISCVEIFYRWSWIRYFETWITCLFYIYYYYIFCACPSVNLFVYFLLHPMECVFDNFESIITHMSRYYYSYFHFSSHQDFRCARLGLHYREKHYNQKTSQKMWSWNFSPHRIAILIFLYGVTFVLPCDIIPKQITVVT